MGRLCHTHFFSYSFHTFPLSAFSYLTFIQPFFSNPERCNTHTHNCVCVSCNVLGSPLFGSADAWSSLVNVKQTCSNKRGPNLDLNQFLGYVLCPMSTINYSFKMHQWYLHTSLKFARPLATFIALPFQF